MLEAERPEAVFPDVTPVLTCCKAGLEVGVNPFSRSMRMGLASFPEKNSSAVRGAVSPTAGGKRSAWKKSAYGSWSRG